MQKPSRSPKNGRRLSMTRRSSLSDNSALGLSDASKDHSIQMLFLTASLMYAPLHAIYRFINIMHDECNACKICRREILCMYMLLIIYSFFINFIIFLLSIKSSSYRELNKPKKSNRLTKLSIFQMSLM